MGLRESSEDSGILGCRLAGVWAVNIRGSGFVGAAD